MSLLPRAPRFLLRLDAITVRRGSATVDAEGDAPAGRSVVLEDRGTLTALSATEQQTALQRGTRVDKALGLELGLDVRGGDWITVGATTYEVVDIMQMRIRQRALLRIVS